MRLIDADALKAELLRLNFSPAIVMAAIDRMPTVDAVPVVHGRWMKDGDCVVCSECGEEHAWDEYRATYCEDCGAKMDGGVDDG